MRKITMTQTFSVSPEVLYEAWLSSPEHSAMTEADAEVNAVVGDSFTAWDGYITGVNKTLELNSKIVQEWRTTDFLETDDSSEITLLFKSNGNGTELTLIHDKIPDGQPDYEQGWEEFYFTPMTAYFSS